MKAGGEIKVTICTNLAEKVREYVSELRLHKTRDIPEGELLSLKVTTFKNEMERKIEEQRAVI